MRKYIINLLPLLSACLSLSACFYDYTTLTTRPLVEIVFVMFQF